MATPEEAGEWLAKNAAGDVVLLKASRGVKLEQALEKWKISRSLVVVSASDGQRLTTKQRLRNRRRIALLAAVSEAVSLFSAVPHFPLSHFPYCVCQSDRAVHCAGYRPARHPPATGISNRPVHPRRRPQGSSEKSGTPTMGGF